MMLRKIPIIVQSATISNCAQDKLPKLPNDQKMYCCNFSALEKYESTLTIAAVILPNMSPIINSAMVSFTLAATTRTSANTRKLPRLDAMASVMSLKVEKVNAPENNEVPIIKSAAPKLAPELMPSTYGPAKGFLNKVCINNPLSESPPPTNIAVIAFGSLYSQMI